MRPKSLEGQVMSLLLSIKDSTPDFWLQRWREGPGIQSPGFRSSAIDIAGQLVLFNLF